ncbi:MAG: TolC family protein [Planctomycetes bacterium]|nr:TolC family protein [Planctomycetota bacterium]
MSSHRTRSGRRAAALGSIAVLTATGCQSYTAAPPALERHLDEWLARSPSAPAVAAFAQSLRAPPREAARPFDASDGLDADEAEVVALVFNGELRRARLATGLTLAGVDHAGAWSDPTLGVDIAKIVSSSAEPWKLFGSLGLTLPLSGRLELERTQAGRDHAVARARLAAAEWRTRMEVRRALAEREAASRRATVTHEAVAALAEIIVVVDRMEQAGDLTRAEARLFRIEQATLMARAAQLSAELQRTHHAVRRLLGLAPSAELPLASEGALAPPHAEEAPANDAATALANDGSANDSGLRRHPALVLAQAEHEAAEAALELEIRRQYPDLELAPGLGREDGLDQVLLGLSLPLPLFERNRRAIAEATARRALTGAEVALALEQLLDARHAAETELAAARAQRVAIEEGLVPLADQQFADARHLAGLGELHALVLLDSLARQREAKLQLIDAALAETRAAIDRHEVVHAPPLHAGDHAIESATETTTDDEPRSSR